MVEFMLIPQTESVMLPVSAPVVLLTVAEMVTFIEHVLPPAVKPPVMVTTSV
jgi:hypothetical protein